MWSSSWDSRICLWKTIGYQHMTTIIKSSPEYLLKLMNNTNFFGSFCESVPRAEDSTDKRNNPSSSGSKQAPVAWKKAEKRAIQHSILL